MANNFVVTSTIRNAVIGGAALLAVGTVGGTVAAGDDSRIVGAVQSSVLTTRGDLPRRGASAWERFAASTADTFVGGDGTDVGVRTAAQVLASLSASRTTTPSLASATGWTGSSYGGGTTGVINTGSSRLDFAVNASGSGSVVTRSAAFGLDWSLQYRVVSMSDTTSTVQLVGLAVASPAFPSLGVSGAGGFECKYTPASGGAVTVRALTAALTGVRTALTAGTLWPRLRQTGGVISYWYGIGVGTAEPTEWRLLTTYAPPGTGDGEPTPTTINIQLARTSSSGAANAGVANISYRDLSP